MKLESVHIESMQIDAFIWDSVCGGGRITVHGKDGDKAVADSGRYMVRRNGRFELQKNYNSMVICETIRGLIDKYERFEYNGFLYHSPEFDIWIKEEI